MDENKIKILVAEDDPEMCKELRELLLEEGYYVDVVHNGLDAIVFSMKNNYKVILLDMKMPKVSGYEVLKEIKRKKPYVKIIVLTGSAMKESFLPGSEITDRERKYKMKQLRSADFFMSKPFNVVTLLETVAGFVHNE